MIDIINSGKIFGFLKKDSKNKIEIEVLEKATSTNTLLKEVASEKDEGFVLVAGEQSAGRGRMGRSFFSPGDTGVYLSLLLKPEIKPEDAVQITTAAAVSVCRALEKLGIADTRIKWVNDIFIGNKKVCGILTEASFNAQKGMLNYAVLGVGVNIYSPDKGFPDEIKDIAGSVFSERKDDIRNRFIAYFLDDFFDFYECICHKKHLEEYRKRNFVIGREVVVISSEENKKAKALDIDENCNLIVELPDGTTQKLCSGEISVKLV